MNKEFYTEELKYEVGETVLYNNNKHKIVHIHEDGLVNLENGVGYIFGVAQNMLYKVKDRSLFSPCRFGCTNLPY